LTSPPVTSQAYRPGSITELPLVFVVVVVVMVMVMMMMVHARRDTEEV
jgi:hypothetical protein